MVDTWLEEMVAGYEKTKGEDVSVELPLRNDRSQYALVDATEDQAQVLYHVLDHRRAWFDVSSTNPEPLRLTIAGVAGSGKSVLITTLVTAVGKMFHSTRAVKIVAPTGQAA
jgi:putative protein kinase ArgK-like GTPase of G3E family